MGPPSPRGPRLREHGVRIGALEPGPANALVDVPGVAVGHATVWRDEPEPPAGRGVARTGVTAIVPGSGGAALDPSLAAGTAVLNGAGELTGSLQVREWGTIETPVYLTATMSVGRVYDGAAAAACAADSTVGVDRVVIPVVGECDDSWLNDARTVQVETGDVARALGDARSDRVEEGCVGAGAGMTAFDWKAGIGTASRLLPRAEATLGVLVLANFGSGPELVVAGVAVGRELTPAPGPSAPAGSCIAVVVTDAPLGSHNLERVARRCGLGLARTGSVAHDGSGEIFVALSTAAQRVHLAADALDEIFAATVEATEEAVLNALWAAGDTVGRDGRVAQALPHAPVLELLARHGALDR